MNTNKLKSFAQETRLKLINIIETKLNYILTSDTAELREKQDQINKLKKELESVPQDQLIEKVAYTWFNRFVALRFMDVNDYQPSKIRAITPKEGFTIPELLTDVKEGHYPEEISVNKKLIEDLLLNRVPNSDPQNEVYKLLLVAFCNSLNLIFPFLFEKINDYTELLMPDDLLSDNSILKDIRDNMAQDDCENVEIIGWLYQFYISEKKDEVFASKSKVKKEDIPAATQLFTPRWIVEYMTQNSVGKLWLKSKPNSNIQQDMKYYIPSESMNDEDSLKVTKPEELTVIDPACGSGHILVYAFELLTKIYEEEGYSSKEIPQLILQHNLTGLDIDERAAQLASFALMMKAREFNRRFFRNPVVPNISSFRDYNLQDNELHEITKQLNINPSKELLEDLVLMRQAKNIGSLITPQEKLSELENIYEELNHTGLIKDLILRDPIENLTETIKQLIILKKQYTSVIANPPYMGSAKMNTELSIYAKKHFCDSKTDLFAMFIERGLEMIIPKGYIGFVTMETWMFLSSYESFRKNIINNYFISTLTHFGWHVMRIAFGTVAFIIEKCVPTDNQKGIYSYFTIDDLNKDTDNPKEFPIKNNGRYTEINQNDFNKIPGCPISYWISSNIINLFNNARSLSNSNDVKKGMDTANNEKYLRLWFEVKQKEIFHEVFISKEQNKMHWVPYQKGGEFRKWYGNLLYIINWVNNGQDIGNERGTLRNTKFYFKESLSWSELTSGEFSVRKVPYKSIFDATGPSIFGSNLLYILGALNTKIYQNILDITSPTIHYNVGAVADLPIIFHEVNYINNIVKELISISKDEYDSQELSISFIRSPLIKNNFNCSLINTIDNYIKKCNNDFLKSHKNEETLNNFFINKYGFDQELKIDIKFTAISLYKNILIPAKLKSTENLITRNEDGFISNYENINLHFKKSEIISQYISYGIGCMFGRYSLDKEGLLLADAGQTLNDYLRLVPSPSYSPSDSNIIPILENDWFKDDIVEQFKMFLKVSFGEEHYEENLKFIEEGIGKDIRKFFTNDFYKYHVKMYKKRPIYWMFSSSNGAFKALIYMHRYNSDTINVVLNKYVREFLDRINNRKNELQRIIDDSTSASKDVSSATKELDKLLKDEKDIKDYEENILLPMAQKRIEIDLDDGVLVNYNKLGKALEKVVGLNDPKTDKKVAGFDWVKR